jgi:hypothetical protein
MIDKKFIARSRLRFTLGLGIIGAFISIISILTFAKVWEETFKFYGIPMIIVYVILPLGFGLACWCIGYFYDVKGIWKEENSHINASLNPEFQLVWEDIRIIDRKLGSIQQQLEELKFNKEVL